MDIDVRNHLSYRDEWITKQSLIELRDDPRIIRAIRFQVTDDSYICYTSKFEEDSSSMPYLTVMMWRDETSEPCDYEVKCRYDHYEGGYHVKSHSFGSLNSLNRIHSPDEFSFPVTMKSVSIRLQFVIKSKPKEDMEMISISKSWYDAIQLMTDVKLIASDGIVTTKMELLMAMSPMFKVIFKNETAEEFRSKSVDMKDYSESVLTAFVKFLETHNLDHGKQFARELLLLANEFDVPLLKERAKKVLLDNVTIENVHEVRNLFSGMGLDLLVELIAADI